ncbi:MAG: LytR C-terminal domain-containing protein [Actinomycetes bacterium]
MLTPLGRGPRRSRRWPRVLGALVVVALIAAAAYGVWWWLGERTDSSPTPAASPSRSCITPTPKVPKNLPDPGDVTLAVANGTERNGLAVDTADAFAARGFVVVDVGNTDKPVKQGTAVVRYAKGDLRQAIVAASYVPGAEVLEVARVPEANVAVWLGPELTGVAKKNDADVDAVVLPAGEPVCTKKKKP